MYRFNGGYGAVTCDRCDIIYINGISPEVYLLMRRLFLSSSLSPASIDLCNECETKDDAGRSDPPAALG